MYCGCPELEKEALQVIGIMPGFVLGQQTGQVVRSDFIFLSNSF